MFLCRVSASAREQSAKSLCVLLKKKKLEAVAKTHTIMGGTAALKDGESRQLPHTSGSPWPSMNWARVVDMWMELSLSGSSKYFARRAASVHAL